MSTEHQAHHPTELSFFRSLKRQFSSPEEAWQFSETMNRRENFRCQTGKNNPSEVITQAEDGTSVPFGFTNPEVRANLAAKEMLAIPNPEADGCAVGRRVGSMIVPLRPFYENVRAQKPGDVVALYGATGSTETLFQASARKVGGFSLVEVEGRTIGQKVEIEVVNSWRSKRDKIPSEFEAFAELIMLAQSRL